MASPGGLCPYCKGEATEETEAPTIVDTCELVDPWIPIAEIPGGTGGTGGDSELLEGVECPGRSCAYGPKFAEFPVLPGVKAGLEFPVAVADGEFSDDVSGPVDVFPFGEFWETGAPEGTGRMDIHGPDGTGRPGGPGEGGKPEDGCHREPIYEGIWDMYPPGDVVFVGPVCDILAGADCKKHTTSNILLVLRYGQTDSDIWQVLDSFHSLWNSII